MPMNPTWATPWLRVTLLVTLGLLWLPFAALPASAQEYAPSPIMVGTPAQIVYGNGQDVLLRSAPGYDQMVVNGYPEGTPVDVIEGPLTAGDGSTWYGVAVYGETGYLAADFLSPGAAAPVADTAQAAAPTAAAPVAETAPAATAPVADGGQELAAAQPAAAPVETAAYATSELNLRAGPSLEDAVLLVIPAGAAISPTGEAANGYIGVTYNGQVGWADGAYVGSGAPVTETTLASAPAPTAGYSGTEEVAAAQPAAAPAEPVPATDPAAPAGTSATVTVLANLRGGPSQNDAILRVLPAGSAVTITGGETNGYVPAWYNGTTGWLSAQAIDGSVVTTLSTNAAAAPVTDTGTGVTSGGRTTLEAVNIRAEPAIASQVIGTIPGGVALTPLAGPESGFYQVTYEGVTGWVSGAYLAEGTTGPQATAAYAPGPGVEPAAGGSGLIWPVTGGSWKIMQGYNGSSHQDQSSTWQYYYSLDLVKSDGNTAGQPVLAPTAGTVRWLDPSTGGISIDIGNGHAVAMFHVTVDPSLRDGTPVQQGQVIGSISGPGGPGFSGTAHLHLALWATDDGGNWSRDAVPFTGAYALGGQEFPDMGGANQYRGTEIIV